MPQSGDEDRERDRESTSEETVRQLRDRLRRLDLPVAGLREDLERRLRMAETGLQGMPTPGGDAGRGDAGQGPSGGEPSYSSGSSGFVRIDVPPPEKFRVFGEPGVATRWAKWRRMFQFYKNALGDIKEGQQMNLLLHVAGPEVQEIYSTFPEDKCTTYETLMAALNEHFDPKKNQRYERFKFRRTAQSPSENMDSYIVRLRKLGEYCEFHDLEDNILDQIIEKGKDTRIRRKLLELGNKLTLEKATRIARASEEAGAQVREIEQREEEPALAAAVQNRPRSRSQSRRDENRERNRNRSKSNGSQSQSRRKCFKCGSFYHLANSPRCPARNGKCNECGRLGHFKKMCHERTTSTVNQVRDQVDRDDEEEEEIVHHVASVNAVRAMLPIEFQVGKASKTILGMLDSGCPHNLMPLSVKEKTFPHVQLEPTKVRISGYLEEQIQIIGKFRCVASFDGKSLPTTVQVTLGGTQTLFGLALIRAMGLTEFIAEDHPATVNMIEDSEGIGRVKGFVHKVKTDPNVTPVRQKLRRIPFALRDKVQAEVERLLKEGIIEKVDASPWISNVVVVQKQGTDRIRLCVDLRNPNKAVVQDAHPIPRIEEMIHGLRGSRMFSRLDLSEAYLQFPLHEESRDLTTFITDTGLYRFKRVCYGLASAPSAFQQLIEKILDGIPRVGKYLDDIVLHSADVESHEQLLKTVLERLSKAGLKINFKKSLFRQESIEFLGYTIDSGGARPSKKKLAALLDSPLPKNRDELRTMLGMFGFYARFIKNYSSLVEPLRKMLKFDVFEWDSSTVSVVKQLKNAIAVSPALMPYDPKLPVVVNSDACDTGIGGTISHVMENGETRVIEFASRTLSESERKFSTLEKEALAIVFTCEKWRPYLLGRSFVLESDHQPLQMIFGTKGFDRMSLRVARWAARLLPYNFEVKFKKGSQNIVPDFLSRFPIPHRDEDLVCHVHEDWAGCEVAAIPFEEFVSAQEECAEMKRVRECIENNSWPGKAKECVDEVKPYFLVREELCVEQGVILRGERIVVPSQMRERVLVNAHEGHPGIVRTKLRLRQYFWWPSCDKSVEELIHNCEVCRALPKTFRPETYQPEPVETPSLPFEKVAIDIKGPIYQNSAHYRFAICLVDYYSKYPEVVLVPEVTTSRVISFLNSVFSREGIPRFVVTDNGVQFTSKEFREFCVQKGIQHMKTSLYLPSSNGLVERWNSTLSSVFETARAEKKNVVTALHEFLMVYRATEHATTGLSPSVLLHGREIRTVLEPTRTTRKKVSFDADLPSYAKYKQENKTNVVFKLGDKVKLKHPRTRKIILGLTVEEIVGPYTVMLSDGRKWNNRHLSRDRSTR